MFVEGYMLVRPGREADVQKALTTRRRTNVAAVVAGIGVGVIGTVIGYAAVLPWVWTVAPALETQPLIWIAPFSAAVIVGLVVAWIVSGIGERRWARTRADPAMMRDGFAFYDAYGGIIPDSIPAQDLWDALDTPGGVMSSPVHVQIMAALREEPAATPPEAA